jgi:hypothetical protein
MAVAADAEPVVSRPVLGRRPPSVIGACTVDEGRLMGHLVIFARAPQVAGSAPAGRRDRPDGGRAFYRATWRTRSGGWRTTAAGRSGCSRRPIAPSAIRRGAAPFRDRDGDRKERAISGNA